GGVEFPIFSGICKFPPSRSAPRKFALRISTPLRKAEGGVNLYLYLPTSPARRRNSPPPSFSPAAVFAALPKSFAVPKVMP
ncbi:MAG: hypothetical protein HAW59_01345, partial [Betaproteobacteria bacterium]|nr:hypothetical protein [Betaproteobacteria bacterium]